MIKFMTKILPSFIITLILIISCTSSKNMISPDVYLKGTDKFDTQNSTTYYSSDIDIQPVTFGGSGFSFFHFRFTQVKNNEYYQIKTLFSSNDWIFVEKIKFLVNKNFFEFNSLPDPIRKVGGPLGDNNIYEWNLFKVNPTFYKAIISANSVSVRLIGENSYIERDLDKKDIKKLTNFISYIFSKTIKTN